MAHSILAVLLLAAVRFSGGESPASRAVTLSSDGDVHSYLEEQRGDTSSDLRAVRVMAEGQARAYNWRTDGPTVTKHIAKVNVTNGSGTPPPYMFNITNNKTGKVHSEGIQCVDPCNLKEVGALVDMDPVPHAATTTNESSADGILAPLLADHSLLDRYALAVGIDLSHWSPEYRASVIDGLVDWRRRQATATARALGGRLPADAPGPSASMIRRERGQRSEAAAGSPAAAAAAAEAPTTEKIAQKWKTWARTVPSGKFKGASYASLLGNSLASASSKMFSGQKMGAAEWAQFGMDLAMQGLVIANPILGVVATLMTSILGGILGLGGGNALQEMYDQIMNQVEGKIQRAKVQTILHVWSSQLTGLVEEVDWVPEMLAPSADADGPTTWKIGSKTHPAESCDEVCGAANMVCGQGDLDDLNGKDSNYVKAKYALAGHTCNWMRTGCAGGSNCVNWGSPYIHNGHFSQNQCWYGSAPTVAPCNKKPVDGNHRRLCPCKADKSRQIRLSWFLTLQNSLAAIKHGIFGSACIQHAKDSATHWQTACLNHVNTGAPALLGPTFAYLHTSVLLEIAAAEPAYKDTIHTRMKAQQVRYSYLVENAASFFFQHRLASISYTYVSWSGYFKHFTDEYTGYHASGNCCHYGYWDSRNIMQQYKIQLEVDMRNSFMYEACQYTKSVCNSPGFYCYLTCHTYQISR